MFRNSSGVCPSSRIWRRLVFQWMMYASSSFLNCSYEANSRPAWKLVLEVAEHLLGRGVVDAVALPAHGLADVQSREPVAPPPVPVLPAHVRVKPMSV